MRGTSLLAVAAGLGLLAASPAAAAPGAPDPAFGTGGFVQASVAARDGGYGIERTADGRYVVAGGYRDDRGSRGFYVARYLANGRPDTSFGTRGVVRTPLGGIVYARAMTQLPDGRVLVAGMLTGTRHDGVLLVRYLPDGKLDPSFGRGGMVVAPVRGDSGQPEDVEVGVDGTFVVVGLAEMLGKLAPFVQRFLPDGSPDTSFGGTGTMVGGLPTDADAGANAAVLLPGGAVVVTGTIRRGSGFTSFLMRYLPDGRIDPTFGSRDMLPGTRAGSLAMAPDGGFVVGGGTDRSATVARFLPAGVPDPTFGTGGVASVDLGADTGIYSIDVLADGRVVASGDVTTRSRDLLVVRLTRLGQRDAAYGRNGVVVHGSASRHESIHDHVLGSDGSLTFTGATWSDRSSDTLSGRFTG